jgi:hypothetical protein
MDITWTHVHVTYGLVARVSFWVSIVSLFGGYWLARRNAFPLSVVSFPALAGVTASWATIWTVAEGSGRFATTAGLAEAQVPLALASFVAASVTASMALRPAAPVGSADVRVGAVLLGCAASLVVADIGVVILAHLSGSPQEYITANSAKTTFGAGVVAVLGALAVIARGFVAARSVTPKRARFVIVSAAAFLVGVITWQIARVLWAFVRRAA